MDWQCIGCPCFINNKSTNYKEENTFCQWEEYYNLGEDEKNEN